MASLGKITITKSLLSGRGDFALTSLELLNYTDPLLSPVALDHLPLLEKLTVNYHRGATHRNTCHLKGWLRSLSHLTELAVNCESHKAQTQFSSLQFTYCLY